ncbi:hypothetical protein FPZ24_04810 [Sphingomonas panacisoli]|uniref:Cell envelope biogenesis protein TolA n=1 Tax=Sphingomonas panacisoli TaxID=1813879 RepID=A0A5B8LGW1_9SPHN|nr:hypothetical protein FPZ24_04810 [Sphingomonas panacisoli]
MGRSLKVFCTPIGFHDAYVAAPSRKAALKAWGSSANLFAHGMASVVTDPKLTKEPLASPGVVIKRARGSTAQHLAALPHRPKSKARPEPPGAAPASKPPKLDPKPSRRKLDAAQQSLARAEGEYDRASEALRDREEALRRERHELVARRDKEIARLQREVEKRRQEYDRAMDEWRG